MRISTEQAEFFKREFAKLDPKSEVYLFGSRLDDSKKGGDIDIMVLTTELLDLKEKWYINFAFQEKFGEQKVDIVNFTFTDDEPFKRLVLMDAIKL